MYRCGDAKSNRIAWLQILFVLLRERNCRLDGRHTDEVLERNASAGPEIQDSNHSYALDYYCMN